MKIIRESGLVLNIDPGASIVSKPVEELWWKTFSEIIRHAFYSQGKDDSSGKMG